MAVGGELRDESHSSFATYLMAQSLQAQSHRDIRNRHDNDAKRVIHIHGSHTDIYGDYVDTRVHTHTKAPRYMYSGENKYLNPCRFRKFGHLQRNVWSIIVMVGVF